MTKSSTFYEVLATCLTRVSSSGQSEEELESDRGLGQGRCKRSEPEGHGIVQDVRASEGASARIRQYGTFWHGPSSSSTFFFFWSVGTDGQ